MAEKDDNAAPIVIKKKKKGEEEEGHGGAWKVAYADFVTAMMAFFLLMWLLNATTEEQRSGIADYFSPVSASNSTSGGGGVLSGQTVAKDGALTSRTAPVGMNMQVPAAPPTSGQQSDGNQGGGGKQGDRQLKQAELKIKETLQQSAELKKLRKHVELERTERGLRIRIMDRIEESMFKQGSAEPRPETRKLLRKIAQSIDGLSNPLIIKGHTDATSFGGGATGYSNWELSSERANAARRILVRAGVKANRIEQVVGAADQNLLLPNQPTNPRNRRISILLLSQQRKTVAEDASSRAPTSGAAGNGSVDAGQQPNGSGGGADAARQPGGPSLFEDTGGG